MTSVITGDIINSRTVKEPQKWMEILKQCLSGIAGNQKYWEIFRGDSFQIEISDYYKAFHYAVYIKAAIKTIKDLDVRMAIGVGQKTHEGTSISESMGEVFIYSGEKFESLKKEKVNLSIKTPNDQIDQDLNLYFKLGLIAMNDWTPNSAEIVKLSLAHPKLSQQELGALIGIKQNTVSERQKRAYLDEIRELDLMYRKKIDQLEHSK